MNDQPTMEFRWLDHGCYPSEVTGRFVLQQAWIVEDPKRKAYLSSIGPHQIGDIRLLGQFPIGKGYRFGYNYQPVIKDWRNVPVINNMPVVQNPPEGPS